jgi:NDP-sugar pyrophosphorylase family protein
MTSFLVKPKGFFISVISPEVACPLLRTKPAVTFPGVIAEIVEACIGQELRDRQALLLGANEDVALPVRSGVTITLHPDTHIGNVERIGNNTQIDEAVQLADYVKIGSNGLIACGVIIERGVVIENGVTVGARSHVAEMARLCIGTDLGEEVIVERQAEVGCNSTVPTGSVIPSQTHYY